MNHSSPYRPGREIARGGMGAVLDARDQKLGRSVAMKVMLRRNASEEEQQRFLQEARVLGQLAHPNIVPVHDVGTDEQGRLFYTMKLVQGVTLHDVIGKLKAGDKETLTRYPLNALLTVFQKVCDAVAFAHSRGIIHRDLKPQNIMVGEFGEVLVMDWGLAKILPGSAAAEEAAKTLPLRGQLGQTDPTGTLPLNSPAAEEQATLVAGSAALVEEATLVAGSGTVASAPKLNFATPEPTSSSGVYATVEGAVMGTPHYMSPEQAEGKIAELDGRSDIFSLGGILYALLTLRPPVEGDSLEEILSKVRSGTIAPPTAFNAPSSTTQAQAPATGTVTEPRKIYPLSHCPDGKVPTALSAVTMKALTRDKLRRYQTVAEFTQDILAYQGGFATSAENANALTLLRLFIHRHKALAAAAALIVVLTAGFMAKVIASEGKATRNAKTAQDNEQRADEEKGKAIEAKTRADDEADRANRQLYIAHMNLAKRAWDEAHVSRVVELLDLHRPQANRPDLRGFEWYYLQRLCHLDLLTLKGHTREVTSVAFSADGKRLASAGADQTVKMWDATSGQETLTLKGHTAAVNSVAFSADGKRLASASDDQTVKVWDATIGQATLTLKGHAHWVRSVAFSADGKRLASASADGTVKVWDATNGQEMLTLKGHTGGRGVWGVTFSADGKHLASANEDGTVKVWDATSGQETLTLKGHSDAVRSVAFSADGKRLASASWDRTVKVWDATSSQETLTLKGHASGGNGVAFSGDGKWLASARQDGTVKVWDATSGQETLTLKGHTGAVYNVAFSADGKRLASASADKTAKVWDTTSGQATLTLNGHLNQVLGVAFSADGKRLASASWDRTLKVWDTTSGQETLTLKGHTHLVRSVAFSADGKRLASASHDGTVKVWDATSGQETLTLKGHTAAVNSVAFSADGKRLASTSHDGTVKVWDATPRSPDSTPAATTN